MLRIFSTAMAVAAAAMLAVISLTGASLAQGAGPINQIKLTEAHVKGFIAAQKDLIPLTEELQKAAESGNITPDLQSKLDGIAKKNGFSSLSELDDVTDNINMVMAGIDPKTGEFKMNVEEMRKAITEEIEEIKKDTTIPEKEKKELIAEQEKALLTAGKMDFPENVTLVKTYAKQIEEALQ